MSVLQEDEAVEPSGDAVVARLDVILEELAAVVGDGTAVSDAARIDRMARLEKLRAVTAAVQAAESVKFAQSQVAEQLAAEVYPDAIGRGIAEQIGLACRISPSVAARRLATARAWWFELPDTYRQLSSGELSEPIAEQVVTETRHLDPERRGHVDKQLHATGIARLGFKAATACIRQDRLPGGPGRLYAAGPHRTQTSPRQHPAGTRHHGYAHRLSAGGAGHRLLRRTPPHADSAVAGGDGRTRDQIMADTLVERITGQTRATDINIELQLMMPLETLDRPRYHRTATIPEYGPLPAGWRATS